MGLPKSSMASCTPHLARAGETGRGLRAGHQQLPARELQHQHHPSRHEMAEEVAALRHQGEVPVDGTDVEADVKCPQATARTGWRFCHRLTVRLDRHGHDQASLPPGGRSGRISPSVACCQRISTSAPTILPPFAGDQRLQMGQTPWLAARVSARPSGPPPPKQPPTPAVRAPSELAPQPDQLQMASLPGTRQQIGMA